MSWTVRDIKISVCQLIILILIVLVCNLIDIGKLVEADTVSPGTAVTVTNSEPAVTTSTVVLHDNIDITLLEWSWAGTATTVVTSTFSVVDGNGWADIATTTVIIHANSQGKDCASSSFDCYRSENWWPSSEDGNEVTSEGGCVRISTTSDTANFLCTTTLHYYASATDAGLYIDDWWQIYVSSSDRSYEDTYSTNTAALVDVATTQAMEFSTTSIDYPNVASGSNTGATWVITNVSTTGNVAIDLDIYGDNLTYSSFTIAPDNQQYTTTSALSYDDDGALDLPSGYETHDFTMARPTTSYPGPTTVDTIYWGIGIPSAQAVGSYTGTNYLRATSTIVEP